MSQIEKCFSFHPVRFLIIYIWSHEFGKLTVIKIAEWLRCTGPAITNACKMLGLLVVVFNWLISRCFKGSKRNSLCFLCNGAFMSNDGGEGDGVWMTDVSEFKYLQRITWCLALHLPLCWALSVWMRRFSQNCVSLELPDVVWYVSMITMLLDNYLPISKTTSIQFRRGGPGRRGDWDLKIIRQLSAVRLPAIAVFCEEGDSQLLSTMARQLNNLNRFFETNFQSIANLKFLS